MDQRLQQAIDAARDGETREAQRLLAQLLKEDPEQVHAWFLLSHLVESEEKQKAYLGKVLSLDPAHDQARQRLAYLHGGEVVVTKTEPALSVAPDRLDMESQAAGDTLPPWMSEEDASVLTAPDTAFPEGATAVPQEDLPDWLQKPVGADWTDDVEGIAGREGAESDAQTGTAAPTMPVSTPPRADGKQVDQSRVRQLNILLFILSIIAIVVLILLVQAILAYIS